MFVSLSTLLPIDLIRIFWHQICSLLHQRYKEFAPSLVQGLLKVFLPGKSVEDPDADKNSRAMKKRSTLKLLLELYFVGVVEDSGIFVNIIKDLTSPEHLKDRDATQTNLSLLASFARQGRFLLGLPLTEQDILEEVHLCSCYWFPSVFYFTFCGLTSWLRRGLLFLLNQISTLSKASPGFMFINIIRAEM